MNRFTLHNLVVNPVSDSTGGFISGGDTSNNAIDMRPSASSRSTSPSDGSTQSASGQSDGFQSHTNFGDVLLPPSIVSDIKGFALTDTTIEVFPGRHVFEGQYLHRSVQIQILSH